MSSSLAYSSSQQHHFKVFISITYAPAASEADSSTDSTKTTIRRFSTSADTTLEQFTSLLTREILRRPEGCVAIAVSYKDSDGDVVEVTNEMEWEEAIVQHKGVMGCSYDNSAIKLLVDVTVDGGNTNTNTTANTAVFNRSVTDTTIETDGRQNTLVSPCEGGDAPNYSTAVAEEEPAVAVSSPTAVAADFETIYSPVEAQSPEAAEPTADDVEKEAEEASAAVLVSADTEVDTAAAPHAAEEEEPLTIATSPNGCPEALTSDDDTDAEDAAAVKVAIKSPAVSPDETPMEIATDAAADASPEEPSASAAAYTYSGPSQKFIIVVDYTSTGGLSERRKTDWPSFSEHDAPMLALLSSLFDCDAPRELLDPYRRVNFGALLRRTVEPWEDALLIHIYHDKVRQACSTEATRLLSMPTSAMNTVCRRGNDNDTSAATSSAPVVEQSAVNRVNTYTAAMSPPTPSDPAIKALCLLQRAVAVFPNDATLYYHLACAMSVTGASPTVVVGQLRIALAKGYCDLQHLLLDRYFAYGVNTRISTSSDWENLLRERLGATVAKLLTIYPQLPIVEAQTAMRRFGNNINAAVWHFMQLAEMGVTVEPSEL